MAYVCGPYASCRDCGGGPLRTFGETYDAIADVVVGQQVCQPCDQRYLFTRKLTAAERAVEQQHLHPIRGGEMAKKKPEADKPKRARGRVNTIPSNGAQPTSQEVAPAKVPAAEAVRQAVEALGEVTIDDGLAAGQLAQLAIMYEDVTRERAAYERKADEAKTAKKALDIAVDALLERVKEYTHPNPLPLFDKAQAEDDRARMIAGGETTTEVQH